MGARKVDIKTVLNGVALVAAVCLPLCAHGGNTSGTVTQIITGPANVNFVYVVTTGSNSALPACSTVGNRYVIDITSNAGKAAYAAVLAAKISNSAITLVGTGTCTLDSNSETVSMVVM